MRLIKLQAVSGDVVSEHPDDCSQELGVGVTIFLL